MTATTHIMRNNETNETTINKQTLNWMPKKYMCTSCGGTYAYDVANCTKSNVFVKRDEDETRYRIQKLAAPGPEMHSWQSAARIARHSNTA